MTAREWPDFAFISWRSQSGRSGGSDVALRCSRAYDESHWQTQSFGEIPDHMVIDVRPLVVIDPDDEAQAEAIVKAFVAAGVWKVIPGDVTDLHGHRREQVAAALREFANPTPPKPDEPTGLGAVVEDRDGTKWIRTHIELDAHWREAAFEGCYRKWSDIAAVRILSEGVTS